MIATLELADGSTVDIRIPAAVAASVSSYSPGEHEVPSIVLTTKEGTKRTGRLGQLFPK